MTSKRRKWVIIVAGLFAAIALITWFTRSNEPTYNGRHLSEWVQVHGRAINTGSYGDYFDSEAAIREAGTNAFPLLLKWIQLEYSNRRHKLPRPLRQFYYRIMGPAEARAEGAAEAFRVLRTNTPPEVLLELTAMLNNSQMPQTASRAARALGNLGSQGEEPLVLALQQPHHPARFFAMTSLYQLNQNKELNLPPKLLLPTLIEFTTQTNGPLTGGPAWASKFLSDLNVTPDQYVSALTNLLADPDATVRTAATNALMQIAPEALTNAPAQ